MNVVLVGLSISYGEHNRLKVSYALDGMLKEREYDIDKLPEQLVELNKLIQKEIELVGEKQ
jgi:hypothetical protein